MKDDIETFEAVGLMCMSWRYNIANGLGKWIHVYENSL